MKISLIIPSRNNLNYLKWAYDSIRKHQGDVEVEICVGDDASSDGTWEWCREKLDSDPNFKCLLNPGPDRIGLTVLYNKLVEDCATGDIIGIYHADMYLCPNSLENVLKYVTPQTVVSLTRVEPPLHPPGREKVIKDFGLEPEDFQEEEFLEWYGRYFKRQYGGMTTDGVFAPWFIYKETFLRVGGHDYLFAPTSKEDSDIWNRLLLMGIDFIQTWDGAVYHMTCRGSRFNPKLTTPGVDSQEWVTQNKKSERNFIRKWGNVPFHSQTLRPIVTEMYEKSVIIRNVTLPLLHALEPWFTQVWVDDYDNAGKEYLARESFNTVLNLQSKIRHIDLHPLPENGIVVEVDALTFTKEHFLLIQQVNSKIKGILSQAQKQNITSLPFTLLSEDENLKIVIYSVLRIEPSIIASNKL